MVARSDTNRRGRAKTKSRIRLCRPHSTSGTLFFSKGGEEEELSVKTQTFCTFLCTFIYIYIYILIIIYASGIYLFTYLFINVCFFFSIIGNLSIMECGFKLVALCLEIDHIMILGMFNVHTYIYMICIR